MNVNMTLLFQPGDIIYGFCDGFFGSDNYDTKKCVYVTLGYAVFEYIEGNLKGSGVVLGYEDRIVGLVENWKKEPSTI